MQVVRNNNLHQDDYSSYLTLSSNLSDSSEDEDLHNAIMASLESEKWVLTTTIEDISIMDIFN